MVAVRVAATARSRALNLLRTIQAHPPSCPCHGNPGHHHHTRTVRLPGLTRNATHVTPDPAKQTDYAFEMAASNIRFGPGVTQEVGMDFANLHAKRVLVVTDTTVGALPPMQKAIESLERAGIKYDIYDKTRVEPKDYSVKDAIAFAKSLPHGIPDAFLAVGGGSVMDTAKIVNLYTSYPDADFLDFVNAPLGKGLPIDKPLRPLICIPTTAGTGSETTGTAIFDLASANAKTGISHRALRPTLGIIDPHNTRTLPPAVHHASGLDVLCHALESYTAIPFSSRTPRPTNPLLRPAYQGANPISDVFSLTALKSTVQHLPHAARSEESQHEMLLAATLAGVGFGNAGVHLCHALSYGISAGGTGYKHAGYNVPHAIIPHGVSVAVTAPEVFRFTAPSNPERHLEAARAFGVDTTNVKRESAGEVLADALRNFLDRLGDQPLGLRKLGYGRSDVEKLVEASLPQRRVLDLAPGLGMQGDGGREDLAGILERSIDYN